MARIGYLVPEFPSQTHAFFWREIQALRGLGDELSLISTRRPPANACKHEFATAAAAETHYVFPPQLGASARALGPRPGAVARAFSYLAGLAETPWKRRLELGVLVASAADLLAHARERSMQHLHVHSCADAAHLAALCRILGGPPYSLTLHGDLPVYGTDHRQKSERAAFVSCVTRPLQRQLVEQVGLPPERAPVIWMGVDTDRFRNGGERQPQAGKLHFLTVARLNPTKAHRHALRAMKLAVERGVDLSYTVAGEGPERASLEAEVARLQLGARVRLTGTISENEVLKLLQRADAFVLPSVGQGEAAPVSVMEAMACGLPVVCSIIGGTPDMITDGVDGFLTPQADDAAIADRLVRLATDLPLRQAMGEAARARAVSTFEARATAKRLHDCIVQAL